MTEIHTVEPGDCAASLAARFGLFWETIWDHPDNAELKASRGSAMILRPGDRIAIPELEQKTETGSTDQRHRFRRRGTPTKLRVQFLDEGKPLANRSCRVHLDGTTTTATTDGDGVLEVCIAAIPKAASVEIGEGDEVATYELDLGGLDPKDTLSGLQQRLRNLGFLDGEISGERDDETERAIARFCAARGLDPDAVAEGELFDRVEEHHGI